MCKTYPCGALGGTWNHLMRSRACITCKGQVIISRADYVPPPAPRCSRARRRPSRLWLPARALPHPQSAPRHPARESRAAPITQSDPCLVQHPPSRLALYARSVYTLLCSYRDSLLRSRMGALRGLPKLLRQTTPLPRLIKSPMSQAPMLPTMRRSFPLTPWSPLIFTIIIRQQPDPYPRVTIS